MFLTFHFPEFYTFQTCYLLHKLFNLPSFLSWILKLHLFIFSYYVPYCLSGVSQQVSILQLLFFQKLLLKFQTLVPDKQIKANCQLYDISLLMTVPNCRKWESNHRAGNKRPWLLQSQESRDQYCIWFSVPHPVEMAPNGHFLTVFVGNLWRLTIILEPWHFVFCALCYLIGYFFMFLPCNRYGWQWEKLLFIHETPWHLEFSDLFFGCWVRCVSEYIPFFIQYGQTHY